jgi:hypothetical protein
MGADREEQRLAYLAADLPDLERRLTDWVNEAFECGQASNRATTGPQKAKHRADCEAANRKVEELRKARDKAKAAAEKLAALRKGRR